MVLCGIRYIPRTGQVVQLSHVGQVPVSIRSCRYGRTTRCKTSYMFLRVGCVDVTTTDAVTCCRIDMLSPGWSCSALNWPVSQLEIIC